MMEARFKRTVSTVELMDFDSKKKVGGGEDKQGTLENVSDIYVDMIVKLGKTSVTVGDVRKLKVGDILGVEKKAGHKVDIYLGEEKVGIGEAVLMDNNFGIIISEINTDLKKKMQM